MSDDEVMTIQPGSVPFDEDISDTATIFEAFKDVSLDLTLSFSTQNSPIASSAELPLSDQNSPPSIRIPSSSNSVEVSPSAHQLSRTMSFTSQLTPLSPLMKTKKKFKSTKFSSDKSSILHRSWPAIKYVGRGTPVDKNRRKEWGGLSAENVGEDGLLFSDVRATSLDSRSPRLSTSSDWDFLNAGISTVGSPHSGGRSISVHHPVEEEGEDDDEENRILPLPKIDIKLESETQDWASVMETALSSAEKGREEVVQSVHKAKVFDLEESIAEEPPKPESLEQEPELPPEEIEKLQSELQFDLNIDKALDLGFTPAVDGGTLFTLAAITDSDNSDLTVRRTATISTHSRYSTPSQGPSDDRPAAGLGAQELTTHMEDARHPTTRALSGVRSTTNIKADVNVDMSRSPKIDTGLPWWRKALGKLKRVQSLLQPHRSTC